MKVTVFNYSVIKNQQDASILDVFIDGDIVDASPQEFYKNWWGDDTSTSFKSFRDQILNSDATRINVNINSGGGMVADALAIHDFIKEQIANGKNIHTYGKGIVASAATSRASPSTDIASPRLGVTLSARISSSSSK